MMAIDELMRLLVDIVISASLTGVFLGLMLAFLRGKG